MILSHGNLALELLNSAKMICGEMENVVTLGVEPGDDVDQYRKRLEETLNWFPAGVFVLVDLTCGTPFNSLMALGEGKKLYGIAGTNLPLLMDVAFMRHTKTLEEISAAAEEMIHTSICDLGRFQAELLAGK